MSFKITMEGRIYQGRKEGIFVLDALEHFLQHDLPLVWDHYFPSIERQGPNKEEVFRDSSCSYIYHFPTLGVGVYYQPGCEEDVDVTFRCMPRGLSHVRTLAELLAVEHKKLVH